MTAESEETWAFQTQLMTRPCFSIHVSTGTGPQAEEWTLKQVQGDEEAGGSPSPENALDAAPEGRP
jgi:hypothetical protein